MHGVNLVREEAEETKRYLVDDLVNKILSNSMHAGKISASAMNICVVSAFEIARFRSALIRNELPYIGSFEITTREGRAISFIYSSTYSISTE